MTGDESLWVRMRGTVTMELDDGFICDSVPAEAMDRLWASGWRHFGRYFFRYSSQQASSGELQKVTPLRIRLCAWEPTKSQRRILRRNADLRIEVVPVQVDGEVRAMFERHRRRFRENVPEGLENFLGEEPERGPCVCLAVHVFEGERRIAVSFLDVGRLAGSSVYALFEPEEARRSLGIFTMLQEIAFCRDAGFEFLYPGYATQESSAYDYKKQFRAMEWLAFETGEWRPL